jgi:beta-barrel assembly-enhancing protease
VRFAARSLAALLLASLLGCQVTTSPQRATPAIGPGHRPALTSAEAGLWMAVDRVEEAIKRSPLLMRDPALAEYVRGISCRVAGEYCRDIRVYVLRHPEFNAAMFPNGTMVVNSGLLLRTRNEAEIAAVIGHEIAHYLRRHTLERFEDLHEKGALAQWASVLLSPVPGAGLVAQIAIVGSVYSFNRDQEREADSYGVELMAKAGYDAHAAAEIWSLIVREREAAVPKRERDPFFATHPAPEERFETLRALAGAHPGRSGADVGRNYGERIRPLRPLLFADHLRLGRPGETIVVSEAHIAIDASDGVALFAKAESLRTRDSEGDAPRAREAYEAAIATGRAPPEAHRGLGLVLRRMGETPAAAEAFRRYLKDAPNAVDRGVVESYLRGGA